MQTNQRVLDVEVEDNEGKVYVVKQPIDNLTYELINQLDYENELLSERLDGNLEFALKDKVELAILSDLARKMSENSSDKSITWLYKTISVAAATLTLYNRLLK